MNSLNDKLYFEVHLNNNDTYYITEDTKKSISFDSEICTLQNIEKIVAESFKYSDQHHTDKFSNFSKDDFLNLFKKKSYELVQQYKDFFYNQDSLFSLLVSQETRVNALNRNIQNLIEPPKMSFFLKDAIINEFTKYIDIADLSVFCRLNRDLKELFFPIAIKYAQELGFEGSDGALATYYLNSFLYETKQLCIAQDIPENFISYNIKKTFFRDLKTVNSGSTSRNLKNLPVKDLFRILTTSVNDRLFKIMEKYLISIITQKIPNESKDVIKQQSGKALLNIAMSCNSYNPNITKFLLENEANPNIPYTNGSSSLHFAAQNGNLELVKLLLEHGANVNAVGNSNFTPLAFVCMASTHPPVAEFLLQKGADLQILNDNGESPLVIAQKQWWNDEIIAILKSYST